MELTKNVREHVRKDIRMRAVRPDEHPPQRVGPHIDFSHSMPSEVTAISPFVDKLVQLIKKCGSVPGGETDVEIALREALANAIVHGNHQDPRKHVDVTCQCGVDEVRLTVKDEGQGFDPNRVPDPTAPKNISSDHGRGIYMMKALMDEVRFEEGGTIVQMRKSSGSSSHAI
jgi:serine/threonine-protein kinase RsbW